MKVLDGLADQCNAVLPLGQGQYPLYRGLGGPQVRSGGVRNTSPSPRFDPGVSGP